MKAIKYFIYVSLLLVMITPIITFAEVNTQGLWLGQIEINQVNEVGNPTDSETPTSAYHPFDMKILIHMNAAGKVCLLRNVTIMKKAYVAEGEKAYRRVLLTDDLLIPKCEGIVRRDGKMIGLRYSCLGFDFDKSLNELPFTGEIGAGKTITTAISLSEEHPTNPFRHLYHPDHQSGRNITRNLSLTFDNKQAGNPDSESFFLTGVVEETITGLHKIPIKAGGIFKLQRISVVNRLNDTE